MAFKFSVKTNTSKLSLIDWSEVSGGRWDAAFYEPSIRELDNLVRTKTKTRLKDLVTSLGGGATPRKNEQERYYADSSNGIPLLRVQNVTEEGVNMDDLVYINEETHTGYLKRSNVLEDDVLVTITGRIASSAVAPKGFKGNINQHIVVLRTGSLVVSEQIATFLNSIVGQKIAYRYATGGTRPALDYSALKNLPIIQDDRIVTIMKSAYIHKTNKTTKARQLLLSYISILEAITKYHLPVLRYKKFQYLFWSDLEGPINPERYALELSPLFNDGWKYINEFGRVLHNTKTFPILLSKSKEYDLIRIDDLPNFPTDPVIRKVVSNELIGSYQFAEPGDLLIARLGPSIENAKFVITPKSENEIICSNEFIRYKCHKNVNPLFVIGMMRTDYLRRIMITKARGAVPSRRRLSRSDFIMIPFPDVNMGDQNLIADEYSKAITTAKQLLIEANEIVRVAKDDVEKLLVGG